MASGRPACASTESAAVLLPANKNLPAKFLLLKVALQAQDVIALGQHLWIDRAVRTVAGGATLAHRFVFEDERASLGDVAFAARFLFGRKCRPSPNDGLPFVRIVTIGATDSSTH
jgi:hypothetical protein